MNTLVQVILILLSAILYTAQAQNTGHGSDTKDENQSDVRIPEYRQKIFSKVLPCLTTITETEIVIPNTSKYNPPGTAVLLECNRLSETDIRDNFLKWYAVIFGKSINVTQSRIDGNGIEFKFACNDIDALLKKNKPCPPKLSEILSDDATKVKSKLISEKNREDERKAKLKAESQQRTEELTKNKEVDTVASVLNFSSGCPDEGCDQVSWYQQEKGTCRYHQIDRSDGTVKKELDLNDFDPKSIKIGVENRDISNLPSRKVIREFTIISYDGRTLISTFGRLDTERILRGWSLIYSKHCKGKQRAF
jgi:hypothetical protein